MTQVKIITESRASYLNDKIKSHLEEGWRVLGSHQVVETHRQNQYAGSQHMRTIIDVEYSITLIKD